MDSIVIAEEVLLNGKDRTQRVSYGKWISQRPMTLSIGASFGMYSKDVDFHQSGSNG